jgi:hypothetical protein
MNFTVSPFLLADPSTCLRYRVLREIYQVPEEDEEVVEVAAQRNNDPLAASLTRLQQADGSWAAQALSTGWGGGSPVLATGLALARLGYLGFDHNHPAVAKGAEFLFEHQREDGAWELHRRGVMTDGITGMPEEAGYSMIPLQTAVPLRGLAACGYAADARCERAYDWLLAQRLPDGAWPTGMAAGVHGYVGGYRRLAHSRWGCRSNTTGALICLAYHPDRAQSPEAKRALDHVLGRETREKDSVGFETARMVGAEPLKGFISYFARFDLGLILDLCWRVGATMDDERVAGLVQFIRENLGPYGLWDYSAHPQASKWVSFDLTRSLLRIDTSGEWQPQEPRTPFQAYPKKQKRY